MPRIQTNFRAEDFMVSSKKDKPAKSKAPKPAPGPDEVPDGSTAEVLAWVGEDKDRAQRALDKENAGSRPRTTLVKPLAEILAAGDAPEGDKDGDKGEGGDEA